jgi:HK97 family phage prohead protease
MPEDLARAQMAAAAINDLPDSAFAYIEPGGQKDDSGKTVPRSLRHFPVHDEAHVRNALSRAPQSPFGSKAMPAIRKAAKKFGIDVSDDGATRGGIPADRARALIDAIARYSPDQLRGPAGSDTGGEFAKGGGKKSTSTKAAKHGTPRKKSAPGSVLGYDAKSGRGTGYGSAGGDARVKRLQDALNRLGLKDSAGKELKVDGKLGPKTTAAVMAAQKELGLTPNGRVTPALLERLAAAKRLSDVRPKPKPVKSARSLATQLEEALTVTRSGPLTYDRSFPLDDIQIMRSGDGRTVEAYAAMFDMPYEVRDEHGHYMEVINRSAFNRTLSGGAGQRAMCLYNHGFTVHGTPSEMGSVPLGTPLEIKPDGRGLLTVTRYNKGPFADQVLESIRNGDIKAQSFRGRIVRSDPNGRLPRRRMGQALPTVTRHELGLTDYGPTPTPVNSGAEIMAVRSVADLADMLTGLDADEREELLRTLNLDDATPDGDPADVEDLEDLDGNESEVDEAGTATSERSEPGAEDPPAERSDARHSGRLELHRARLRAELIVRGISRAEAA